MSGSKKKEGASKRTIARVRWAEKRRSERKIEKGQRVALKRALGVLGETLTWGRQSTWGDWHRGPLTWNYFDAILASRYLALIFSCLSGSGDLERDSLPGF